MSHIWETIGQIAVAWLILSIITGIGWAIARANNWIGFEINQTPCGDLWRSDGERHRCTRPRGHTGLHTAPTASFDWADANPRTGP
jgi:hypothetical protein